MRDFKQSSQRDTRRFILAATLICFGTLFSGCQPSLSFKKQYSLASGEIISLPIDAVGQKQTIQIAANSTSDEKFTIYVYLSKDEAEVDRAIATGAATETILASSEAASQARLSAVIPANESSIVRVDAKNKPVTVDIKINN